MILKNKSMLRDLFCLVFPMAIQNLLVTVVNASDAIMLGSLNVGFLIGSFLL